MPGLDYDHRHHRLDPARMRHSDHRHLGDLRQLVDRLLDVAARDILTAAFDHVLLAVDDTDVTVGIDGGEIAGVEPIALEGRFGAFIVVEITEHQMRRAMYDLADFTRAHIAHPIIDHAGFDVEHGTAARARLA